MSEQGKNYCYYKADDLYIVGVAKVPLKVLEKYPMVLISDEDAQPFYDGKRSYNGPWQVQTHGDLIKVVEDKLYNIRIMDPAQKPGNKFYQVERLKDNNYPDYLIDIDNNTFYCLIDPEILNKKTVEFYITERNNPNIFIRKISHDIKEKEIDAHYFNIEYYSVFSQTAFGTTAFISNIDGLDVKPFDLLSIYNNKFLKINPIGSALNSLTHPTLHLRLNDQKSSISIPELSRRKLINIPLEVEIIAGQNLINNRTILPKEINPEWFLDIFEHWSGSICFILNKSFYIKYTKLLEEGDSVAIIDKNNRFMTHYVQQIQNETNILVINPNIIFDTRTMDVIVIKEDKIEILESVELKDDG